MTVLSSTTKHKKNEYAVRMPHKQFRKKAATIFIKIAAALRAESGTRTRDLFITNELLYQLSYFGDTLFFLKCDAKVVNNILLAKYFAYFFFKAVIFMVWRLSLVLKSFSDSLWSWHKQWCATWHFSFSGDMFIAHWLSEKGRNFLRWNFEVCWKSVGLFFLKSICIMI